MYLMMTIYMNYNYVTGPHAQLYSQLFSVQHWKAGNRAGHEAILMSRIKTSWTQWNDEEQTQSTHWEVMKVTDEFNLRLQPIDQAAQKPVKYT